MTIAERCQDAELRCGHRIGVDKLRHLYRAAGIRQKQVVALSRSFTPHFQAKRMTERRLLMRALRRADEQDVPLYFIEETSIVQRIKHRTWS